MRSGTEAGGVGGVNERQKKKDDGSKRKKGGKKRGNTNKQKRSRPGSGTGSWAASSSASSSAAIGDRYLQWMGPRAKNLKEAIDFTISSRAVPHTPPTLPTNRLPSTCCR